MNKLLLGAMNNNMRYNRPFQMRVNVPRTIDILRDGDVSALSDGVSIWLPRRNLLLLRTILSQNTKKAKKAVIRVKASIQKAAMKKFSVG